MCALYLGFDLSTQSLKAEIVNDKLERVNEAVVNFDTDLPEFRTSGGVNRDEKNSKVVTAQPLMWVKAIDIVLEKLRLQGVRFDEIAGISGAAQQHGSVYWKRGAAETLQNLDPSKFLHEELGFAFSVPNSPIWMDSSTTKYCDKLEEYVGGPEVLSKITGSRAYERFTGNQIAKIIEIKKEAYSVTERISLISSFVCSVFLGAFAAIDYSDGSGMNLLDIRTKQWSRKCLEAVVGGDENEKNDKVEQLIQKLGQPVPTEAVQGVISNYFVERYEFSPECKIISFTGDNQSSFAGMCLGPHDIAVSLGTSDTVFFSMDSLPEVGFTAGHIFINPIESRHSYMAIAVFKNGSLTRDRICRDVAERSWDLFDQLLDSTPRGNFGNIGFYFDLQEILPKLKAGDHRFNGKDEKLPRYTSKEVEVRALVEGQFLSKRVHAERIGCKISNDTRILATGGASSNKAILQVLSDIFNSPVFVQENSNSASTGGCYRVKYSIALEQEAAGHRENGTVATNTNGDYVHRNVTNGETDVNALVYSKVVGGYTGPWKQVCEPSSDVVEVYDKMLERFKKLEDTLPS